MSNAVSQEDSLSQFQSNVQEIIGLALRLNWRGYWTSNQKQMIKLHAPKGETEFLVPSTNVNAKRAKSWVNKIARYSDPGDLAVEADAMLRGNAPNKELRRAVAEFTGKTVEPKAKAKTAVEVAMQEATKKRIDDEVSEHPDDVDLPYGSTQGDSERDGEPYVVSSLPWLVKAGASGAKDGSGSKYESPHTLEQLMSDGTTRYKCKRCDFTHKIGKHVSIHSGQKHGPNRSRERIFVSDYGEVEHRPQKEPHLITDILAALDGIENWHSLSKEELAHRISDSIIEARPDREPAVPLTAEQIVERIRYMVDGERIGAMHDEVAHLREQYTEAVDRAEKAETDATKLRENVRALDSMMKDVLGDEAS